MASTRGWLWTALPVLVLGLQLHAAAAAAQQTPAAGTNNSCIFANDGECDETNGTCAAGTDSADCRPGAAAADPANSCRFAFDQRCDEPGKGTGHCAAGTDTADCAAAAAPPVPVQPPQTAPAQNAPAQTTAPATGPGDDSCPFAKDNDCDEPVIGSGACAAGTDTTDCKAKQGGVPTQPPAPPAPPQSAPPPDAADSCPFARDGECDEPGIGSGACNAGTDTTDCKAKRGDLPVPASPTPPSPTPPSGAGNDSCPFAKDGECDEPGVGSGACTPGTDATDCQAHPAGQTPATPVPPAASGDDSCQFAKDHECDDPDGGTGLCAPDTDVTDCRAGAVSPTPATPAPPAAPPAGEKTWSGPADSCEFAHDGECDEPAKGTGLCSAGTDTADCSAAGGSPAPGNSAPGNSTQGSGAGAAAPAACPFAKDGDCDEPGKGTGLCAAGTDVDDCRGK